MIHYISLGVSLIIAGVAAYFSIVGLATLFAGAFYSVIIMASVLEVGKLVTATWLHLYWDTINAVYRTYLFMAVITLMLITSMGIFGYLSKAYYEQITSQSLTQLEIDKIQYKIDSEQSKLDDINSELENLDKALEKFVEMGYVSKGLDARESQRDQRNILLQEKNKLTDILIVYKQEQMLYNSQMLVKEAELGPLKYVGQLLYGTKESITDKAIIWVILLLMFAFDPLAVILLIVSANSLTKKDLVPPLVKSDQIYQMG